MSPSYISKLLSGASELRLDHVVRICRAAGIEPAEFFSLAYPRNPASSSLASSRLMDLLQNAHLQPPAPQPLTLASAYSEEQIQVMLKATLEKMLGRMAR
ncbi:MAG TPA: helix-turn-helix transcriptional regulator [Thermoanaerobaculia bacterium]|nr:helix-turn-helix transcriptional regulator [Thermoanaerobaculia bacterium]